MVERRRGPSRSRENPDKPSLECLSVACRSVGQFSAAGAVYRKIFDWRNQAIK
jgi:hypothetical protein